MPSKTLHSKKQWFSKAMYLQTLNSYAPIPIIYGILMFMALPMNIFMAEEGTFVDETYLLKFMSRLPYYATTSGLAVALLVGGLSAMLVFRYLTNNRSANMVHSLPIRREALYITQYLAGLSFVFLPNLIILGLSCLAFSFHGVFYFQSLWILFWIHCGIYFFFYSFACFCGMFTGAIGATGLYYLAFNFMVVFITVLLQPLFEIFYLGYNSNPFSSDIVMYLTPIYALFKNCTVTVASSYDKSLISSDLGAAEILENFSTYSMAEPLTFGIYLLVAVIFTVTGLFIYKLRHIETAGEAVSIPLMKPVFRFVIAVLGGISLGVMTVAIFASTASMSDAQIERFIPVFSFFWCIVFSFVAEMILQKSFRVLQYWKNAFAPMVGIILIFSCMIYDFTGYEEFIPDYEEVLDVSVHTFSVYPIDSVNLTRLPTENNRVTESQYQLTADLHKAIIREAREDMSGDGSGTSGLFTLYYSYFQNQTLSRQYYFRFAPEKINEEGSVAQLLHQFYNDKELQEYIFRFDSIAKVTPNFISLVQLYSPESDVFYTTTSYDILGSGDLNYINTVNQEIVQALADDFAEGNLGQKFLSYDDPEYIETGIFGALAVNFTYANNDITGKFNEITREDGSVTRSTQARQAEIVFALNQSAKNTFAVLDKYGLLDEGYFLTNQQRMEKEMAWYQSSDPEDEKKLSFHWDMLFGGDTISAEQFSRILTANYNYYW